MPNEEIHSRLARLQESLTAFHGAVGRAHARAAARILRRALRQIEWLGLLAHETAQDAWLDAWAALQEYLAGLRPTLPDIGGCTAEVARRVERAQAYWRPPHFAEAAADVLSRKRSAPEDLTHDAGLLVNPKQHSSIPDPQAPVGAASQALDVEPEWTSGELTDGLKKVLPLGPGEPGDSPSTCRGTLTAQEGSVWPLM